MTFAHAFVLGLGLLDGVRVQSNQRDRNCSCCDKRMHEIMHWTWNLQHGHLPHLIATKTKVNEDLKQKEPHSHLHNIEFHLDNCQEF